VNEQNKNARRPFQTAGERLDDMLGEASARIEEETQMLIKYINDELVPAIRQHSTSALRVASEKLAQAADHMDSSKQGKR
jgi:phytoene dehydrogenase-like protein